MSISSPRVVESLFTLYVVCFKRFSMTQKPGNLFTRQHLFCILTISVWLDSRLSFGVSLSSINTLR